MFRFSNHWSPDRLPLIGIDLERWTDHEYGEPLPGIHLTISWKRTKWWGSDQTRSEEYWILRGSPWCYVHRFVLELNWPCIYWR